MALVLRDQMSIVVDIPDDLDGYTMREAIQLTIAIVLEVLFILARVVLISFFILRGIIEVWPTIGFKVHVLFVNLCWSVANGTLEYGRYYQG